MTTQKELSDMISELNTEIDEVKEDLINKILNKKLSTYKFDESNLSQDLINKLKQATNNAANNSTTQSTNTNMPIPLPIPKKPADSNELLDKDFIAKVISDMLCNNNVFLYGKAGTGKTYSARKIAELVASASNNIIAGDFYIINCNQFTSPTMIIGGNTIDGYREGQLIKAWRDGGTLILDELPKLDPNTAGVLNEALAATAEPAGYEITDGKGDKIPKHANFYVIATGNTDMKTQSLNYSGNNRQDYSLIDRFAGSYHYVSYNDITEMSKIYPKVYKVSIMLRTYIDSDPDAFESISLRTMLNFNRTYQAEMLHRIGSPYAQDLQDFTGREGIAGKTLSDSVNSFLETLGKQKREELKTKNISVNYHNIITGQDVVLNSTLGDVLSSGNNEEEEFTEFFKYLTLHDPITGELVSKADCKYPVQNS